MNQPNGWGSVLDVRHGIPLWRNLSLQGKKLHQEAKQLPGSSLSR